MPIRSKTAYTVMIDVEVPQHAVIAQGGLYIGEACVVPFTEAGRVVATGTLSPQDGENVRLRLKVKTWVPAQTVADSSDDRTLGVSVRSITLRAEGASARVFNANTGEWSD